MSFFYIAISFSLSKKPDRREILNEIDKSMIYLYIKNWLDNRVGEAEVYKNLSRISEYGE